MGLSVRHRKHVYVSAKELNRLIISEICDDGSITITILDIIHRPVFYLEMRNGNILALSIGPI
jgi:hypothetical protein